MTWAKAWACSRTSRLLLCSGSLFASCGLDASGESGDAQLSADGFGSGASEGAGAPNGAAVVPPGGPVPGDPGGVALPPEVELNLAFELPHAGERYVYAANPESDSVAVIDATTLAIAAVEAGDQPRFLQTLARSDAAVVLNVGSSDATILRTRNGSSTTVNVPVQQGANAIAVSPDGAHAVVYFDALHRGAGITGSYQDISVLFLDPGDEASVAMTVGFRPSAVHFSADGARAFVTTEDGVSVLDLAEVRRRGAHIAPTLPLGNDATLSLDVSVTPDGAYALARREGDSQLRLLDLDSGEVQLLDLGALIPAADTPEPAEPPTDAGADAGPAPASTAVPQPVAAVTDVDLAPSGAFALAVVRDRSTVLAVPIPDGFDDPEAVTAMPITGELIGSVTVAPDSSRALLYTTVVPSNERLSVLDIDAGTFQVVRLPKSVERVTLSPDGTNALIVHQKLPGDPDEPGLDPDAVIDRSYGYSVVNLDTRFSKLQTSRAPVGPSTVVPTGTDLFVLFNDPGVGLAEVHQVELESFLVERIVLGSPPNSVGSVPGSQRVFVGQEHPDGRITFIDWETGDLESVTGFELNSRIRE